VPERDANHSIPVNVDEMGLTSRRYTPSRLVDKETGMQCTFPYT